MFYFYLTQLQLLKRKWDIKYGTEGSGNDSDDEDNDDHDNDGVYLENKVDLHHVECGDMSSFEPVITILDGDNCGGFFFTDMGTENNMQDHDSLQVCLTYIVMLSVQ